MIHLVPQSSHRSRRPGMVVSGRFFTKTTCLIIGPPKNALSQLDTMPYSSFQYLIGCSILPFTARVRSKGSLSPVLAASQTATGATTGHRGAKNRRQ